VREAVIEALSALGAAEAVPLLIAALNRALEQREAAISRAAARGLLRFADATAIPTLRLALQSPDLETRITAAEALGAIGSHEAIPSLEAALGDSEANVRAAAASALGGIGDPSALLALQHYASDHAPILERRVIFRDGDIEPRLVSETVRQASTDIWRARALKSVQVSAHYPKEVVPHAWYSAHMYIFAAVAASEVEADVRTQLGRPVDEYRSAGGAIQRDLRDGIVVKVTPLLEGFEFNPPFHYIQLFEPWHRVDFRLRASEKSLGSAANGAMLISIDGAVVVDVSMSIFVGDASRERISVEQRGTPAGSIFCSYSHKDEAVAQRVERVCRALGIDYLRDRVTLKSGQKWDEGLLAMIHQADIFQLFWSTHAAESRFVDQEWRYAHALARDRTRFIRPVYWSEPMSPAPAELSRLHFAYAPELLG